MKPKNFLIAYDIFDPKRLRKVKEIVYSYSLGGQKSAIEAPLNQTDLKMLITELSSPDLAHKTIINPLSKGFYFLFRHYKAYKV